LSKKEQDPPANIDKTPTPHPPTKKSNQQKQKPLKKKKQKKTPHNKTPPQERVPRKKRSQTGLTLEQPRNIEENFFSRPVGQQKGKTPALIRGCGGGVKG